MRESPYGYAHLIHRVNDLEKRVDALEGQIRARLKEEADAREIDLAHPDWKHERGGD